MKANRCSYISTLIRTVALTTVFCIKTVNADGLCRSDDFSVAEQTVMDAYAAYYGRPADSNGLEYWADQIRSQPAGIQAIINAFAASQEFEERFSHLNNTELVSNIYRQLFNRAPDQGGLDYYVEELNAGRRSLQAIALDILSGAQNSDVLILNNKRRVMADYLISSNELRKNLSGDVLAELLAEVSESEESVTDACTSTSIHLAEGPDSLDEVIRLPVVVHVIYTLELYNITPEKIRSQMVVINEDFTKQNVDHFKTPLEFTDLVANVGIEFELATLDPEGNPTTGVTRTYSELSGWDGHDEDKPVEQRSLYFTDQGGHNAWPTDRYLNIWVAEMSDRHGRLGLAGYTRFPDVADPRIDGVVIDPRVFGSIEPLADAHALGRTATHEIGHWLDLHHIYRHNGDCEAGDEVDDTPTAMNQYIGVPVYPRSSCGSTDITMNYMDNVRDEAMYMFTNGQKKRMRAVFARGGPREGLYKNRVKQ